MATKVKDIYGYIADDSGVASTNVTVRFTSDSHGESISLQVGDIMIGCPFEGIWRMIREARIHEHQG